MVEHTLGKGEVTSSILVMGSFSFPTCVRVATIEQRGLFRQIRDRFGECCAYCRTAGHCYGESVRAEVFFEQKLGFRKGVV